MSECGWILDMGCDIWGCDLADGHDGDHVATATSVMFIRDQPVGGNQVDSKPSAFEIRWRANPSRTLDDDGELVPAPAQEASA